jgi:hypothetical protein
LLAEYSARCGRPAAAAIELMLTIAAWADARSDGSAAPGDTHKPEDVDVQNPVPFVVGVVLDTALRTDPGTVDQDVQPAEG